MSITIDDLYEALETVSPSVGKFAVDRSQIQRTFEIEIDDPEDLLTLNKLVLGYTNYSPSSDGRLARFPPIADAVYANCFASDIDVRGKGFDADTVQGDANPEMELPTIPSFNQYTNYEVTVLFTQRQYSLLANSDIMTMSGEWTPDTNTDPGEGEVQTYQFANEWTRYCEVVPLKPSGDFITQQTGTMVFNSSNPIVQGKVFGGNVALRIPNYDVSVVWHQVPLRYITSKNSYIMSKNWQNRINQNQMQMPWNGPGDFILPGQLLYKDFTYVVYTPSTGLETNLLGNGESSQKLADITLNFVWTNRELPNGESLHTKVSNLNYVAGGHNLLPFQGTRTYSYAELQTIGGDRRPDYLSAPLELLWTDPDCPPDEDLDEDDEEI